MSRKTHKSVAVWKDTSFEWCIERELSLFVRNRCIFFHARGDKYLKVLNLAKRLCVPNMVCVVYIYGDVPKEETLRKRMNEAEHQLVVILVPVMRSVFADIDASDNLKTRLKKMGYTREMIEDDIAKREKAIAAGDIDATDSYYNKQLEELEILNRGEKAFAIIAENQRGACRVITNFAGDTHFGADHDKELLKLIRAKFPCGVEKNAPSEVGAKILGKKRLVAAAVAGIETDFSEQCCGRLYPEQFSLFDTENAGAVEFIEDVRREIKMLIDKQGYFHAADLIVKFRLPPYGMYDCNYYFYLFALALSCITNEKYAVYDGVTSRRFGVKADPEYWLGSPYGTVKFEDEKTDAMTSALFEIFDDKYYDGTTFEDGILSMFKWCTGVGNIQEPLAMISERWEEFIHDSKQRHSASGKIEISKLIDQNCRLSYYDWICDVEKRRAEVKRTREMVYELYPEQREKLALFYRFYTTKGGAAFMWEKNWMIERLEEYMKSTVCRECGREIESKFATGTVYEWDELVDPKASGKCRRETYEFTKKDVIGLNKKFLGRQRDEYYCVPCLCEILDMTVPELWNKMHDFKEQGCTLF